MQSAFRRCLRELDVAGMRRLCQITGIPQPLDDAHALASLHYARTVADSIPFKLRAWSHYWLLERALPSGLPDELKPKADRLYPRTVEAVGISVKAMSEEMAPIAAVIERAMSDAVAEAYADGERRPEIVRARMNEARLKCLNK